MRSIGSGPVAIFVARIIIRNSKSRWHNLKSGSMDMAAGLKHIRVHTPSLDQLGRDKWLINQDQGVEAEYYVDQFQRSPHSSLAFPDGSPAVLG